MASLFLQLVFAAELHELRARDLIGAVQLSRVESSSAQLSSAGRRESLAQHAGRNSRTALGARISLARGRLLASAARAARAANLEGRASSSARRVEPANCLQFVVATDKSGRKEQGRKAKLAPQPMGRPKLASTRRRPN